MALDGSFSLEFGLKRFLDRCPKLECLPRFVTLKEKGITMTEDDVVNTVAEVFLHPNYTIPLVGCFRPIAWKIVDKTIALLRLVPNLRSNSHHNEESGILDDAEINIIDLHNREGLGLNLHELACVAFSRALDLFSDLLETVLSYFQFAPPPFERIQAQLSVLNQSAKDVTHLLDVVRTSYRLLLKHVEFFSKCWDWSCFFHLVQLSSNLELGENVDLGNNMLHIRWCGIQILSVVFKNYNTTTTNLCLGAEEGLSCLKCWNEYCQDISLETAGSYLELREQNSPNSKGAIDFDYEHCLRSLGINSPTVSSSHFLEIESSTRRRKLGSWNAVLAGAPFFMTSTLKKSFEIVLLTVSQKLPVLLCGPPGSGKTALISKLALDSRNQVLSIHMDDQIDSKTLIGSYVCTEQPGEFRWQPGSLTQAVKNGLWVVFEDIDKAPTDVLSILWPLLEGASFFTTGHGEAIRVSDGFRMFSTITSSSPDISRSTEGRCSLGVLWRRIMIGFSNKDDFQNIVKTWYPYLEPLAEKLVETFQCVTENCSSFSSLCQFSLRDLLKWCKRISSLGFSFTGDGFSVHERTCIYQEAVDVFASFSTSIENRLRIMKYIAKMWGLPDSVAETLYPLNKPIIQHFLSASRIGRITLQRTQPTVRPENKPFVGIRSSLHVLERIACSVTFNEPVLLVGETGTGKTTLVQNLSLRIGQKLTVLNLSQQTDIADLLGGFKPMDAQFFCFPLYKEFESLFSKTFSVKVNLEFVSRLQQLLSNKNWKTLLSGMQSAFDFYQKSVESDPVGLRKKRKKLFPEDIKKAWDKFGVKLKNARGKIGVSSGMLFSFVEGAFVNALRNGEWILLDEVNLAPPETLQRIIGVLDGENGSFCLAERGDINYIDRHPDFRIFACMNPATDAGKRDLPYSIRSRFTEYFVDDVLDQEDLTLFITQFMDDSHSDRELVNKIVHFYQEAKKESDERLQDGANQKPQYSLRSLYRALEFTQKAKRKFGFLRAVYDGFSMFFLTLLDRPSAILMNKMILTYLLGGHIPPHVPFDGYLIANAITSPGDFWDGYVLTKSVKENLRNLARAVFIKRYPVLLQGPTSSGKTSLVQYLAALTGHEFVRINNHEHTDLQEYLGFYITDSFGKLVFQEGMLVKAVRKGYWIVLDELNLAPSDVLEALNRLLDDNRELFIPELNETVRAHPDFMLFATQNPPNFYGGRKMLSRAFRNRFVEIHVEEIPEDELSTILEKRCKIPDSYATKMVEVMKELQLQRQISKVFAGKHGFITPRDLFRWADRFRTFGTSYKDLARDGYYLLAERLRDETEKIDVKKVLEKHLRVKLLEDDLYKQELGGSISNYDLIKGAGVPESLKNIAFTPSMWRLLFLVERCYKLREPVILVGETGGGKTTICQLLSIILGLKLHILNCHQYTETSDFLGGFHPIRERSRISSEYTSLLEQLMMSKIVIQSPNKDLSADISRATFTLDRLDNIITYYQKNRMSFPDLTSQDLDSLSQVRDELVQLHQKWQTIFTWQDGPLVQAMKDGHLFLVDEISLADDSVLERLNSVLEPERKLSLAEKGGPAMENIVAHPDFFLLATMNPGGDYGKKELSPALRNRFTEIWVPAVNDLSELRSIALQRISPKHSSIVGPILTFMEWFNLLQIGRLLTTRDLLSWVTFIDVTERCLQPECALLHGAFLILLDGLSLGTGISKIEAAELREQCFSFLVKEIHRQVFNHCLNDERLSRMENYGWGDLELTTDISCVDVRCDNLFGICPFFIEKGNEECHDAGFDILAPTTRRNSMRVLRAMQLKKPVLLEGSPGVGKTSLIVALGKLSGHRVVRINLSEQTDIMDLLGSDLPIESDEGIKFAWSDGILLQALKNGFWVLLDELNLAPQSVLEGLNAILDHRAEVFIPDLGQTFKCPTSFRVFACQNPSSQGGGRKGLPKSFLNRFTKVYVDELVDDDYDSISRSLFPSVPENILANLINFNKRLHEDIVLNEKFARDGSPWEFNLRDLVRACQIMEGAPGKFKSECFLNIVYAQRMRTTADRREVLRLYEHVFGEKPFINPYPRIQLDSRCLTVGNATITRNNFQSTNDINSNLKILPGIRNSLEAVAQCVQHQWLCILIGPPASGKTSLIRLLSQLTGNVLNELSLSPATDISELLGCFEQYDAFRNFRSLVTEVTSYINECCSFQLESSMEMLINERKDLVSKWSTFLSSMSCEHSTDTVNTEVTDNRSNMSNSTCLLVEIIERLRVFLVLTDKIRTELGRSLTVTWSCEDLNRIRKITTKMQEECQRPFSAKFEWVKGLLIKAIENGEWIVLENANLCNPTVLDRINSLVEHCGSITVNECGTVDGNPVVVHPHSNFRMFLTVNPTFGEVSRAMRNRGVEIFIMPPYWLLDGENAFSQEEAEHQDLKRFLVLSGIPGGKLVDAMVKAHLYAKNEILLINVDITLLELARWVQLFQQLITNGNQPRWSLQISWEHTYISCLGEIKGGSIIARAKESIFFSHADLFNSSSDSSLYLPGGWPMPLRVKDMILYSKETSLRQNFMYLEFLGAQYASYEFCTSNDSCFRRATFLVGMNMLHQMILPRSSNEKPQMRTKFDFDLASKSLLFAANWTFEQATENDLDLYLLWFNWIRSQLQPYSHFFDSFVTLFKEELKHPIWILIKNYRKELFSCPGIFCAEDSGMQPIIPMLCLDLAALTESNDMFKKTSNLLRNAIKSVAVLRLSFQQWNAESVHNDSEKTRSLSPILKSLQILEKQVLEILVESPSFDDLIKLYTDLLDNHISFWNSVTSSNFEHMLIFWRSLIKNATKMKIFCSAAVKIFLMESRNMDKVSSWHFNSQKSLLWVHGGHPFLPQSHDLYYRQHQIVSLCESIWPRRKKSFKIEENHIAEVLSFNPELRLLAMQGVGLSSYIMSKYAGDSAHINQQLEDLYQMLLGRVEHEKQKLVGNIRSSGHALLVGNSAACCTFCSEVLCWNSVFNSWQETLPIVNSSSSCIDMELLQELSMTVLVDTEDLHQLLVRVSTLLETSLKYSINFSSRPPTNFAAHQKILWTLDAWKSVDAGHAKLSSYVLEMWMSWHSNLWNLQSACLKSLSKIDQCDSPVPYMLLVQPILTATTSQILKSVVAIKDYEVHRLKLRSASLNLWQSFISKTELPCFLLSVARALFKQIIYSHGKSFEADKFSAIKSHLGSFEKTIVTDENLLYVRSLIASSSHRKLISLMDLFIEPLLRELYQERSPTEFLNNLGCAWLHIGGLRFHLLLQCDELDPALKYFCKYSQLVEKISSLKLEIKVRNESDHLAGWFSAREADREKLKALSNLEVERKYMQRKIVFRADPGKFRKLKYESDEFLNFIKSAVHLIMNVEAMDLQQMTNQVCNWQETTTSFIGRLSDEYSSYIDIIQPVQVSVYEMKLGLSLVLSNALQKEFLKKVGQENMDQVLETIYSFMRFPRGYAFKSNSINVKIMGPRLLSYSVDFPTNIWAIDIGLMEKLGSISRDVSADNKVSQLHLKASIYQNILARHADFVTNAQLLNNVSFVLVDEMFTRFAVLWMDMKQQAKDRDDHEAQLFKFRPRLFKIESIFESHILTPGDHCESESFTEWQEFIATEENNTEKELNEDDETLVDGWNFMGESILKKLVHAHNQMFGSIDLSLNAANLHSYDSDRLLSFMDSYTLGVGMIKGMEGFSSTSLDAKLVPEHLLRLSLEHEHLLISPHKVRKYNFYKNSNAPLMAKMVDLLATLNQRVLALLIESEDHPGLRKILDVIEILLAIPPTTPLSKALLGLQFLYNRVQTLQEYGSKFSLSVELDPIINLACSWKKMEYDSWAALLDEVQDEYDANAAKLWFPLHSVLFRPLTEFGGYNDSTIMSLKDFIRTSSVGEFRRRLQLLFAFHGQIYAGICLESYSSLSHVETMKILYNIFGRYMQFLPVILEYIQTNLRAIEKEIKDILKICRYDRPDSILCINNSKKVRQKLRKLIQKLNDLLSQPVMIILQQEASRSKTKSDSVQIPNILNNVSDQNEGTLSSAFDMIELSMDRCMWYDKWQKEIDSSLQNLLGKKSENSKDVANSSEKCLDPLSPLNVYQEEWKEVWFTIESVCRNANEYGKLWKDTNKGRGKRRAMSEFLNLLKGYGLSKHKPLVFKDPNESNGLFLQPSFDMEHLLLTQDKAPNGGINVSSGGTFKNMFVENLDTEWRSANQFYFKSMESVQILHEICSKFHKDFTLDEVEKTGSFLDHLIEIQQEQRVAAYSFVEQLRCFRKCVLSLKTLYLNYVCCTDTSGRDCHVLHNQHAIFKCMWQQKQLFDSLFSMLQEEYLLLKTVESCHTNSCQSVKAEANGVLAFIDKFIPICQKSKESLDSFLLANDGKIITLTDTLHPYVIPREMDQLAVNNFLTLLKFEEDLGAFRKQDFSKSIKEALLSQFDDILLKGKLAKREFDSALETKNESRSSRQESNQSNGNCTELETAALKRTLKDIIDTIHSLCSITNGPLSNEVRQRLQSIPSWKFCFESYVSKMRLNIIHDGILDTIVSWDNRASHVKNGSLPLEDLGTLHQLSDILLKFGEGLLHDFLSVHKTVSVMTHVLANLFASLYSKGYGTPDENEEDDADRDKSEDATGTGMGEGEGKNDVSDQITDEDQLLGTQKQEEEQNASNDVSGNKEKGIEMEEDFDADAFNVSEDESNENNDESEDDEKLESQMGENGDDSEVVDEKLWDNKADEENPNNTNEKRETGPSVKDNDPGSRELRANDETNDDSGELNPDEAENQADGNENQDALDNTDENMEGMNMENNEIVADDPGMKIDEQNQDMEVDEQDNADPTEETIPDDTATDNMINDEEEIDNFIDENLDEGETEKIDGISDADNNNLGMDHEEEKTKMDLDTQKDDVKESRNPDTKSDYTPNDASIAQEEKWSNSSDTHNDLAPIRRLPSTTTTEMEVMAIDTSEGGKLTEPPKSQLPPQHDSSSSVRKTQPNPYRNVGDPVEEWKERVKVSVDLQGDDNKELPDENADDDDADEYGFVSEHEKGTAQALGPATSEQMNKDNNRNQPDGDGPTTHKDDLSVIDIEMKDTETHPSNNIPAALKPMIEEKVQLLDLENLRHVETLDVDGDSNGAYEHSSDSLVAINKSYMSEHINQLSVLSLSDDMGKAKNLEPVSSDVKDTANSHWTKYELQTTRLSQELAEQLRLVMEPTLASKLQGDYKTGKRINMKKVIPYIASQYRKDKIWLRRTRPNKRDYQVVIAVDDSRSMSESCCADVAIEALVTVCRAMSQLEIGKFAVASYGKKGNIKLLHDFDQPFSREAGVKIISNLTFTQENSIIDEPVVDLLKYLNDMLDGAAVNARLPSGQNPLQQLVLIIGDGRLHEKDNLKRCIRDVLSKKRMVAYLLLDRKGDKEDNADQGNKRESIMETLEASFQGGNVKLSKYIDSFPFPYYLVLKESEALPRALADLLRQWFELMQNSRE